MSGGSGPIFCETDSTRKQSDGDILHRRMPHTGALTSIENFRPAAWQISLLHFSWAFSSIRMLYLEAEV